MTTSQDVRKLSVDTKQAMEKLAPNLAWFLSPSQMERLAVLLAEDNPKAKEAGHAMFCAVHEVLDQFGA